MSVGKLQNDSINSSSTETELVQEKQLPVKVLKV